MANKRIKIVSRKSKLEKAKSSSGNNPLRLSKMLFKKYSPLFLKKKLWLFAVPLFAIILMFSLRGISDQSDLQTTDASAELPVQMSVEAQKKGGDVDFYILKKGEDLYDGLKALKVSRLVIPSILDKVKDKISESQLLGGSLSLFSNPANLDYLVFEPRNKEYQLRIDIGSDITVGRTNKTKKTEIEKRAHLVTSNNIYNSLSSADFRQYFIADLFDLLAWNVDVSRITTQNKFKLKTIYENSFSGNTIDSIRIRAIQFYDLDNVYEFYRFKDNKFYDGEGKSAKKQFLKAPIDYKRISSEYGNRIHPIKGFAHVHKGIDYAAPEGTNIRALADGVITRIGFTTGNGNFIKIRHDDIYETQYLHMKTFAPNMEVGVRVNQGQLIGYVGSTGAAQGDHVCLRFWKHQKQVNFLKEENPEATRLRGKNRSEFNTLRDSLKLEIQKITYQ